MDVSASMAAIRMATIVGRLEPTADNCYYAGMATTVADLHSELIKVSHDPPIRS